MSPVIGFRVWRIEEMLTGPRLVSPNRHAAWLPGLPLKAECRDESGARRLASPHRKQPGVAPPLERCTCGIYAFHEVDDMVDGLTSRLLGGAVLAWGRITIHQEGFRAEFARPLALCYQQTWAAGSTTKSLARIADIYGLPVVEASHIAVFAAEFGESYLPACEPSDDWTARLGTSVRRAFGSWFRG